MSMASTKPEIIDLLVSKSAALRQFGVQKIGLFGSFVRDEARSDSDIDLLVEFLHGKKSYDNLFELTFFLKELFGRNVEVVTPESLSKHIGKYILNEVEYVSLAA